MRQPLDAYQKARDYTATNEREIDIGGLILDQAENPLTNIVVGFIVSSGFRSGNRTDGVTTTDGSGRFRINGYTGSGIAVEPKLTGYTLIATNNRFLYSEFFGNDPLHIRNGGSNRVIWMWKQGGAQKLLKVQKTIRMPSTNGQYQLDVLNGTLVKAEGDLSFNVHPPRESEENTKDAVWSVTVEAVNGGLKEIYRSQLQYLFEAPTNGYKQAIEVLQKGTRTTSLNAGLSLISYSRQGAVFSKVGLGFYFSDHAQGDVTISVYALSNTNFSRSFE